MAHPPVQGFRRVSQGRTGWTLVVRQDGLRVVRSSRPPRPDEPADAPPHRRSIPLVPPSEPTSRIPRAKRVSCSMPFALVPGAGLIHLLCWKEAQASGGPATGGPIASGGCGREGRGIDVAPGVSALPFPPDHRRGKRQWEDAELLATMLRQWEPNTRARQMAHDRLHPPWRQAHWSRPPERATVGGNGKAAAAPEGVQRFTDGRSGSCEPLASRNLKRLKLELLAWDLLICLGLRPAEL